MRDTLHGRESEVCNYHLLKRFECLVIRWNSTFQIQTSLEVGKTLKNFQRNVDNVTANS